MQQFKKLENVLKKYPGIKEFAKIYNNKRFEPVGFVIYSFPKYVNGSPNKNSQIIGLWVFDKERIRNSRSGQICEDFIEYNQSKKNYTYYSGGWNIPPSPNHKSICEFCKKFGKDNTGCWKEYGCQPNGKINGHRYDITDKNLPKELWIKKLLKAGYLRILKTP